MLNGDAKTGMEFSLRRNVLFNVNGYGIDAMCCYPHFSTKGLKQQM